MTFGPEPGQTRSSPHDLRLAAPALGAWVTAAALVGASAEAAVITAAVAAAAAGVAAWTGGRGVARANVAAAALVCAAAAAVSVGLRLAAVHRGPVPSLAAERGTATLELVVTGSPRLGVPHVRRSKLHRSVLVHGRAETLVEHGRRSRVRSPVLVIASGGRWASLAPGQRVRVSGRLVSPDPGELLSGIVLARGPPEVTGGPGALLSAAERVREGLRAALRPLPDNQRGLVLGLVLGDTSAMPPRLTNEFRVTGLAHLLAASGANVAIVLGTVLGVCRLLGLGIRAGAVAGGLGVVGFAVLAGPAPSVLRATVMGLVAVAAIATGRPRSGAPALCAAVIALVLFDPGLVRSYGFALSVLATAGLVLLAPALTPTVRRRLPRALVEAIAVTVAAQVACLPVLVLLSGRISLAAVPCNLLAAPAVAPATVLGLVAAVTAIVALPVATPVAAASGACAGWIVEVARRGSDLPYAAVRWPTGVVGAVAAAALCAVVVVAMRRRGTRRYLIVAVAGLVVGVAFVRVLGSSGVGVAWPPRGWRLVACDVGQGDALVLAAGPGSAVVVDAGPDPRLADGCLDDLGVRRVPLLVLSHLHADHVEGIPGVLDGRTVGAAVTGPLSEPAEEAARVAGWLRGAHVRLRHVTSGYGWRVGPLRLRVLGPAERPEGGDEDAINNASLVLRASWPRLTALLTGDVQAEAQRALLDDGVDLRALVLKVPHHGSGNQDPRFLAAVGAGIGIISVGAHNDYGHPAAHTLRLLRRVGTQTFRTDQDGDVAVVTSDSGVSVVSRGRDSRGVRADGATGQRLAAASRPATDSVRSSARVGRPMRVACSCHDARPTRPAPPRHADRRRRGPPRRPRRRRGRRGSP